MVFNLKRVWNFFSASGSIWVACLKKHIFNRQGFWLTPESPRFSSAIRSILQLRPMLSTLMRCVVGDGENARFQFDNWTSLGPLIEVAGQGGPWSLKNASVFDATRNGSWNLPAARYDDLQRIQIAITEIVPLVSGNGHDLFLWRKSNDSYGPSFSSKNTWEYLRVTAPTVYWHKVIWFKNIPRNTFTAWRALLRRLQTKDRLQRWGIHVLGTCVLCNSALGTHHHLFFECSYSSALWTGKNPLSDLHSAAAWINSSHLSVNRNQTIFVKLFFQSIIFSIWKERNTRFRILIMTQ